MNLGIPYSSSLSAVAWFENLGFVLRPLIYIYIEREREMYMYIHIHTHIHIIISIIHMPSPRWALLRLAAAPKNESVNTTSHSNNYYDEHDN